MQESLYFTDLVDRRVVDADGQPVGVVIDLVVTSGDLFPRISGLVVLPRRSGSRLFVPFASVADLRSSPIRLDAGAPDAGPLHLEEGEARLGHTFLDKQIVDTQGVRVVRVNDLKLALFQNDLRLLGADVGIAGMARRMHAEAALRWITHPLKASIPENVIPWNFVDPLSADRVRLNVTRGRLAEMRPADLADVLEQLPESARTEALADLTDEQIADTLSETRPDVQRAIIEQMEDERASDILEHMAPDDATDLLQDLEEKRREDLLERMDIEDRQEISELLGYRKDSAAGLMTTEVVRIPAEGSAADAIALLRTLGPDTETVYYLYVVDQMGRLEGVVSLRALITAAPSTPLRQLANTRVHAVRVDDDQEIAADMIARYNLLALPVLDDAGVMKGIVTVDDVIDVLREEASEEISLMSSGVSSPGEGAPAHFSMRRAAWFLVVLGATIGMGLGALRYHPRLNAPGAVPALIFLPLLLEAANAAAFGIATVTARQISEEASRSGWISALQAELPASGMGMVFCTVLAAIVCIAWPGTPAGVQAGVPLGILLTLVYSTVCGILLPLVLSKLRLDPTRGLRPLLIGIVSGGALLIYFGILRGWGGL